MSEDWGIKAAKRLQDQAEGKRQEDALVLQERLIREEQGVALWNAVRQFVKDKCDQMNTELRSSSAVLAIGQSSELKVRLTPLGGGTPRDLQAKFKPTSGPDALTWSTSGHRVNPQQKGQYEIAIERGKAIFRTNLIHSDGPEEIAEKMLDALLLE
jgi:hypothetical protein